MREEKNKREGRKIKIGIEGISKAFPGVKALSDVNLDIYEGEVHALCGENGAGKSTLMKILTGNYLPDQGRILLNDKPVVIRNQAHAQELGISIVYQERSLSGNLTVAENIFTNQQPHNKWGFINKKKLWEQTRLLLQTLDLAIEPNVKVADLSSGLQQMIEIAKALSRNPGILILDEPTASITESETMVLFKVIRELQKKGTSVFYISHRMEEIFQIADRISVLKDGCYQGTFTKQDTSIDEIIRLMVRRELKQARFLSQAKDEVVFEARELTGKGFSDVSFQVFRGEILAFAGLVGAGRTEVARAIFGADPAFFGSISMNGKDLKIGNPSQAIRAGIGYLPEERKEQGLFMNMSIESNIIAGTLDAAAVRSWIHNSKISKIAQIYTNKLGIKSSTVKQKVNELSGGNQQKVVLAKWLLLNPSLLIVDEPTHGVDVGAKMEIYHILHELAKAGTTIILISSELPEILTLSDRILVMRNGRIATELNKRETTEQEILAYASGIYQNTKTEKLLTN
ncbi:sugar ABC transporter ATP-binding protein [Dyadobacter bucti]|uniref:sugar ABC transporter ATP-binding protein n=1 Tax=Dyadobacter bucti TaxID=2572203 RepID=UPI001108FC9B|nr:sugar ABC transporter ATP-binding protein [Dyadobacter bucti]